MKNIFRVKKSNLPALLEQANKEGLHIEVLREGVALYGPEYEDYIVTHSVDTMCEVKIQPEITGGEFHRLLLRAGITPDTTAAGLRFIDFKK